MAAGLPSAVLVEIEFTAGVWTDVASLVKGDSIEIRVGRDSAASGIQPGTLDLDLDNADGRFTPDNPTSTHYPNFVEGKRIRVRVTKSATTYVRFVGRITSLEPSFPTGEPSQSITHLSATDTLGDLARIELPSIPQAFMLAQPTGTFFSFSGPKAAYGVRDVTDTVTPFYLRRITESGSIEADSDSSLGDGLSYVQLKSGVQLAQKRAVPQSSLLYEFVQFLVKVEAGNYGEVFRSTQDGTPFWGSTGDVRVLWQADGFNLEQRDADGAIFDEVTVDAEPGWHSIRIRASDNGISLDGAAYAAPAIWASLGHNAMSVGGSVDMTIACLATSDTEAYLYDPASVLPFIGSPDILTDFATCVNATDLKASFAWSGTASTSEYAPTQVAGRSALDSLLDIALTESGIAYHAYSTSATQQVVLVSTDTSRPATVALTVDAEGDLSGAPQLVRRLAGLLSSATASSASDSVTVQDTSVTSIGATTAELSVPLANENWLHAVASDAIAQGKYQTSTLTDLAVDLATASNDLYASFYAVTPGERLRLSGLPTTYFGLSYIDGYVEGWTERPGVTGYPVVFDLSPADAPPEAIADTSRAPWGDGVCTVTSGTAVGTTSTGTIVATFTGTAALSTSAGDYPMDFDWNGERVTVTSAPAGGTSPRTLTLTARGVAPTVARVHAANEALDVWQGARAAR